MIALKINDTVIGLTEEFDGVGELDGRWSARIRIDDHKYLAVVNLIHLGKASKPVGDADA